MSSSNSSSYSGLSCACCADLLSPAHSRRDFLRGAAGVGLAAFLAPQLSFAASGNYEAMLLSCIDPRFQKPVFDRQVKDGLADKYSAFTVAGASIGVVAPAFKAWQETFWENLAASIQLHNIKQVIVVNHRDCGAAKGKSKGKGSSAKKAFTSTVWMLGNAPQSTYASARAAKLRYGAIVDTGAVSNVAGSQWIENFAE